MFHHLILKPSLQPLFLTSTSNLHSTPYDAADEKKAASINYTCKKCNLIFQRYYELIRHQKNHCFKEENNKKSAKAQIAAAQIAQSLSSEDSNSSLEINHASNLLGNNLLHPVTSTTSQSQQNLAQSLDAAATPKTPPIAATKMNLNHPVNLITTTSGTHPNIMVNEHCHNLQKKIFTNFQKSNPKERKAFTLKREKVFILLLAALSFDKKKEEKKNSFKNFSNFSVDFFQDDLQVFN